MKSDKWKTFSGYGLYEYIGEEKNLKENTEKTACHHKIPSSPNFSNFWLALTRKLRHLEKKKFSTNQFQLSVKLKIFSFYTLDLFHVFFSIDQIPMMKTNIILLRTVVPWKMRLSYECILKSKVFSELNWNLSRSLLKVKHLV